MPQTTTDASTDPRGPESVRDVERGKAHRVDEARETVGGFKVTVCGRVTTRMVERIPVGVTAEQDRCVRCWARTGFEAGGAASTAPQQDGLPAGVAADEPVLMSLFGVKAHRINPKTKLVTCGTHLRAALRLPAEQVRAGAWCGTCFTDAP